MTKMARTTQDIIDHAEELARRFESYEPRPGDRVSAAEIGLRRAAMARAASERQIVEAVAAARADGVSWGKIGAALGTSPQAAQQRYSPMTARAAKKPKKSTAKKSTAKKSTAKKSKKSTAKKSTAKAGRFSGSPTS